MVQVPGLIRMSAEHKARISAYKPNKGGKGSICVIGGSFEYAGAPFFSAISALRTGVDLSFVICDKNAANVIKSYSPELIVFGLLDRDSNIEYHTEMNLSQINYFKILRNLEIPIQVKNRVSAIIVGPGLSRNATIQDQVKNILLNFDRRNVPIIFDGDGIVFYKNNFDSIGHLYPNTVLTPNINEFKLLQPILDQLVCIIYAKGETDVLISSALKIELRDLGCPRRCGGIGDVLSGVIAAIISMSGDVNTAEEFINCILLGGKLVRLASKLAFGKRKRCMSALDVIENIGISFEQLFE